MELSVRMLLVQLLEPILESSITRPAFQHRQRLGDQRVVSTEEGDTVTVACGVDTHANAVDGCSHGHKDLLKEKRANQSVIQPGREEGVSLLQ